MLLELFILFFVISIFLIFLGYYSDTDTVKIVGWLLVFILGYTLLGYNSTGVDYQTGQNITKTDNFNDTYSVATYDINYNYVTYTNKTLGFYIGVLGMLGFASVFLEIKKGRKEGDDNE
jgi:hypothetical protein